MSYAEHCVIGLSPELTLRVADGIAHLKTIQINSWLSLVLYCGELAAVSAQCSEF